MKFIQIDEWAYKAVMDENVQNPGYKDYKDLVKEIMKRRGFNPDDITDIDIFKIPYKKRGKVIKKGLLYKEYEYINKFLVIMGIAHTQRDTRDDIEEWTFLTSSKSRYGDFYRRGFRDECFLKEAFNDFRGKRALLGYLAHSWYERIVEQEHDRQEEYEQDVFFDLHSPHINTYTTWDDICYRLKLPYDMWHNRIIAADIRIEGVNFDALYSAILDMLPIDCDFERTADLESAVNSSKIKRIEDVYGRDFERKERVLKKQEIDINNLSSTLEVFDSVKIIEKQITGWKKKVNAKTIPQDFGNIYIDILYKKLELLKTKCYNDRRHSLEEKYGTNEELKKKFLIQIEAMDKEDVTPWEELLDEYESIQRKLRRDMDGFSKDAKKRFTLFTYNEEESPYYEYIRFYKYGITLVKDIINRIDKSQWHGASVPSKDLEYARKYFYKDKTPEDIEEALRKEFYLINKKAGKKGEDEVDYALKWLDKSYICVPKKQNEDGTGKTIVIYNPSYIDEKQECDHIVVGKQGVFLIETKNYVGKLIIDSYGNWIRIKKDGVQEGERNPIQQIRRHEKLLKSCLPENVDVISLICMSHPKMIVEGVENSCVPVIKSDLLAEFIEKYPSQKKELSKAEMKECLECITSHMI